MTVSSFSEVFVFSTVCTRLFHHGVSVCLQGNQFLHVPVACCSARRPSTSGHKRPCQLMPKPGSCLYPRHSKQLLHVSLVPGRKSRHASCTTCKDSAANLPSAYACICTYLLPTCTFQEHIHRLENTSRHAMQKQARQPTLVHLSNSHLIYFSSVSVHLLC